MVDELDGVPVITFSDADAWEDWLAENYELQSGLWVKVAKKGSGIPSVTSDELVDVGLCWGWISGQRRGLDERYYLQKYVPRRPRSLWSQVNVEKVAMLRDAGRMREPGMAEVRAAQADGRWDAAYESQKNTTVPPEVVAALADNPKAREFFESLSKSSRYYAYVPFLQARTAKAKAARLQALIAMMEAGEQP